MKSISNVDARHAKLRRELSRYLKVLCDEYGAERVYLFGSLAKGNIAEWSDIDLLVIKETNERFLERSKNVIRCLKPRVGLEVLVYTPGEFEQLQNNRPFFRDEVMETAKLLYERKSGS